MKTLTIPEKNKTLQINNVDFIGNIFVLEEKMKKIFFCALALIVAISVYAEEAIPMFSINSDSFEGSSTYNEIIYDNTRDELINTYSLFNEHDGIYPTDLCYATDYNKIFVYGQRVIKVFDALTNIQLDEIEISSFGHKEIQNCKLKDNNYHDLRILYVNDRVYSITEGLELLMIDADTHEVINIASRPAIIGDSEKIGNMILKYNEFDNRLYWIINEYDSDEYAYTGVNVGGRLAIYDIISNNQLNLIQEMAYSGFEHYHEDNFIRDIEFHPVDNYFYISINHAVMVVNSITFNIDYSYETDHFAGYIECIYDEDIHKLICMPNYDSYSNQSASILVINLDTFQSTNIIDNYPFTKSTYTDQDNDRIYIATNTSNHHYIMSFDYTNDILNESYYELYRGSLVFDLQYIQSTEHLFIGTSSGVEVVDCSVTTPTLESEFCDSNYHYNIDRSGDNVWVVNLEECSIEKYNFDGTFNTSIHIGEEVYKGIVCGRADRIFMFKKFSNKLAIFNIQTQVTEFFDTPGYISDISADDINDKLYIVDNNGVVRCYHTGSMMLLSTYLMTNNNHHGFSFLFNVHNYNGYLYAGGPDGVDIWNLYNPGQSHISFEDCSAYDFETDYDNQRVIAIAGFSNPFFPNPGASNILILSGFETPISYEIPYNRNEFVINRIDGKIYFLGINQTNEALYSLDLTTGEITEVFSSSDEYLLYIKYSFNRDEIYVNSLNHDYTESNLCIINIDEPTTIETVSLPPYCSQMFYNEYNSKLYILNLHDRTDDYEMKVIAVEMNNNNALTNIPLEFKERIKGHTSLALRGFSGCKSIIPYMDKLYLVRGNNVLQEILCTDCETKILSKGWNWESFPHLERDVNGNVNAPLLFEDIQNFVPGVEYLQTIAHDGYLEFTVDPYNWSPETWNIQSPWLYKIDIDPEEDWILELYGERLEPSYFVEPPTGGNFMGDGTWYWLGYWLPDTYDMDIAFGENVWQWVKHVKAEEWYYGIPENNRDPVIEPKPSNQMRALEYGKGYMVQFKTVEEGFPEEGLPPFQWSTGETSEGYERAQTENFTCEEEPDYEAIDVMEIPENVIEIGVFQEEECVGTVAVKNTNEQILVYVDNSTRDQVPYNFELITNNRSLQEVIDYSVLNLEEGIYENRSLIAGSQSYSVIKFGNLGDPQNEPPFIKETILHGNHPNPFNPETNISFSIPSEQIVKLTIYNLKGQKVRELINGQFVSGEHSVIWNGKDDNGKQVGSGLYFYKLKTDGKEISKKMLLIK